MPQRKKLFVKTFGCQMNVYDSERIVELLGVGYVGASDMQDADLIVLNTCHIRDKAAEKVYSELGRIRQLKAERNGSGREMVVAVAGCVAQAEGAEIIRRAPVVDLVIGPQSYHRLPDLIVRQQAERRPLVDTDFPDEDKFAALPARKPRTSVAAFLTVQEGCNKFCTFCVVPYTRGVEFSRPVARVEAEARELVAHGVREITLLGQNVNAYHGEGPDGAAWGLAALLSRLAQINGLERLRYTTSHPRDMTADLIVAHRDEPKLMPFVHLPFQSGADRILAAMNRKHTIGDYLSVVERLRAARPDIALSTDIIVGFPGETEADFEATLAVVRTVKFAQAYSFKFSPRPGTPAALLADELSEDVKTERLLHVQTLLDAQQRDFNRACVGRVLPVLLEKSGRHPGQIVGRSPYLQAVHVEAPGSAIGQTARVEIIDAGSFSLSGVIRSA